MDHSVRPAPLFIVTVATMLLGGLVATIDTPVIALTNVALDTSTLALPLTYWPVWAGARDRRRMGEEVAGPLLGELCLILVVLVALAALPALILGS